MSWTHLRGERCATHTDYTRGRHWAEPRHGNTSYYPRSVGSDDEYLTHFIPTYSFHNPSSSTPSPIVQVVSQLPPGFHKKGVRIHIPIMRRDEVHICM